MSPKNRPLQILIVEDEAPAARRLQKLLEELRPGIQVLDHMDSVESAASWFDSHPAPDLVFMDIQLSDGLSFEIFDRTAVTAPVVFTTAYDEYALKAFKVNSIDYLLKPINISELESALQKYEQLHDEKPAEEENGQSPAQIEALLQSLNIPRQKFKSRFLIKIGDKYISVATDQIAYFYTEEKSVFLLTHDKVRYPVDHSLDDLEKMLDPSVFFRANRQFIINIEAVNRLHSYFNGKMKVYLRPEAEQEVIVSRDKASLLKAWLDR